MQHQKLVRPIILTLVAFALTTAAPNLCAQTDPQEMDPILQFLGFDYFEYHGFAEARSGFRLLNDPFERDMSIMESRLQTDLSTLPEWGEIRVRGDVIGDFVTERCDFDLREAQISFSPFDFMDARVGRQILTWGTGDLVFLNDMFPKDWQSFFTGRDVEYLKAPSDAAKFSIFTDLINFDIVYTPQFDPDRHITGERISYWNGQRIVGNNARLNTDRPNDWFRDDEIALRAYRMIGNYEVAAYAYRGFWKSPAGQNLQGEAIFPDLSVYGASVRGNVANGIGNAEFAYYNSEDDQSGRDPLINNSEFRFLVGYTQELARDFHGGFQYYVEQMTDYGAYRDAQPFSPHRDRTRHLLTFRLTRQLLNQNLTLSLFTYYSPSDADVYMRPNLTYKITDALTTELGANIFFGDQPHTFFGQFHNNTNMYAALRYTW
ncbi:MAG: hypothetical protein JW936_10670 [Sedimentisphaerales bacterium]|nr:hypothetical protein [Sedimentisphaerales bacterium]